MTEILRAVALFAAAGLAEIGGGWLVWQWLRVDRPWPVGMLGALVLIGYGILPTLQNEENFGRVYAAYGGVFVVMSLAWAATLDGFKPDHWDLLGSLVVLAGVALIFFAPRST